jgi:hypothetical protein
MSKASVQRSRVEVGERPAVNRGPLRSLSEPTRRQKAHEVSVESAMIGARDT